MGKLCAVDNCDSGTYRQVKRRKERGLRQLSFFNVPKCPNKRRAWSEVIGRALTDKEHLCELHFNNADIKKINKTGKLKLHYTIGKNAIPVAINDNAREMDEPEIVSAIDVVLPPAEEPVGNILPVAVNDNISTESEYGFADHLLLSDLKDPLMNDEALTIEEPEVPGADIFSVYDVANHFDSHPLPRTWCWMMNPQQADSVVFTQLDPTTGNIRLRLDVDNDLSVKLRTPDDKVRQDIDITVHSIQDLETALKHMEITPMCCGTGFEADRNIAESPKPPIAVFVRTLTCWSSNCLVEMIFAYVTCYRSDKAKVIYGNKFADSRSERCQGFIDVVDYANNVRNKRCPACRRLRVTLQNRVNRKKASSVITRYARSMNIRHLQHQQQRRLQRRVRNFKMELESSNKKCAEVEEQAFGELGVRLCAYAHKK